MITNSKDFVQLSTIQHCDWQLHFDEGRVEVRKVNHQQEEVLPMEVLA